MLRLTPHNGLASGDWFGGAYVDSTSWVKVGWGVFVVPFDLTRVILWPRMRISMDGSQVAAQFELEVTLYEGVSEASIELESTALATTTLRATTTLLVDVDSRWYEDCPIDLRGVDIATVNGKKLVYTKLRARAAVTNGERLLQEFALGWRLGK